MSAFNDILQKKHEMRRENGGEQGKRGRMKITDMGESKSQILENNNALNVLSLWCANSSFLPETTFNS